MKQSARPPEIWRARFRKEKDMKSRTFYNLKELLKREDYYQNLTDEDIEAAADYIEMQGEDYTIFQWLEDTGQNYPQWLQIGERCWE